MVAPVLDLDQLLRNAVARGASDVHIKVGSPPFFRVDGRLDRTDLAAVSPVETERVAFAIMPKQRAEEPSDPAYHALKRWRLQRARTDEIPAYVVFHNSTLAEIAERRPKTITELASVPGVGPAKLERYGEDVLAALAS